MIYALIENGTVTNLIEMNPEQEADFPGCVSCEDVPAHIGDAYENGVFYRDGEQVKTYAELAEEAANAPVIEEPEEDPEATNMEYARAGRILLGVSE